MIVLCTTCFQGADPLMRDSLNTGIGVLLGVTGVVLVLFGLFFVRLAQRARAAAVAADLDADAFTTRFRPATAPGRVER